MKKECIYTLFLKILLVFFRVSLNHIEILALYHFISKSLTKSSSSRIPLVQLLSGWGIFGLSPNRSPRSEILPFTVRWIGKGTAMLKISILSLLIALFAGILANNLGESPVFWGILGFIIPFLSMCLYICVAFGWFLWELVFKPMLWWANCHNDPFRKRWCHLRSQKKEPCLMAGFDSF